MLNISKLNTATIKGELLQIAAVDVVDSICASVVVLAFVVVVAVVVDGRGIASI